MSYANVTATLALLIAVATGGAYAAERIGTNDLRRGAVTSPKIDNKTIRAKDIARKAIDDTRIADHTIRGPKIRQQTIPRSAIKSGAIGCVELDPTVASTISGCSGN